MAKDIVTELIKSERDRIEDILQNILASVEGYLIDWDYGKALDLIMVRIDVVYAEAYQEGFDSGYWSVLQDMSAQIAGEELNEV